MNFNNPLPSNFRHGGKSDDRVVSYWSDFERMDDAERCVLTSIVVSGSNSGFGGLAALSAVREDDFQRCAYRALFLLCRELHEKGVSLELTVLWTEILRRGLDKQGLTEELLAALTDDLVAQNWAFYVDRLKEFSARRVIKDASYRVAELAEAPGDLLDVIHEAKGALQSLEAPQREPDTAASVASEYMKELDAVMAGSAPGGLKTGLRELDAHLESMLPGQLIVVGARPGVGKSALAEQIAIKTAKEGKPTLFVSLEMSKLELMERYISQKTGLSSHALREKLSSTDYARVAVAAQEFYDLPLIVMAGRRFTLAEVQHRGESIEGLALVVVDYLQILGGFANAESQNRRIAEQSMAAKGLAQALRCPIMLLSQLRRPETFGAEKRPTEADLRDSGAVEADADVILLLYRPAKGKSDASTILEPCEIIIAKQRRGELATALVGFNAPRTSFLDYDKDTISRYWAANK